MLVGRFRRFDLGNKAVDSSVFDSSVLGVIVTIVSVTLMTVLFLSELMLFIKAETTSHMTIADFHEHDTVYVRLHATFPHIECKDLEMIADSARGGSKDVDATSLVRAPASRSDMREFEAKAGMSGCTVNGAAEVARAGGSIRIHVVHHDPSRVVSMGGFMLPTAGELRKGPKAVAGANVTHKIHDFGFETSTSRSQRDMKNPLAGSTFVSETGPGQVRYSLQVVPTSHRRLYGREVKTHTYASNLGFVPEDEVMRSSSPSSDQWLGVAFEYDFTPVMVQYTERRKSFFEFLASVCAIVGGIHTVSGLIVQGLRSMFRSKRD